MQTNIIDRAAALSIFSRAGETFLPSFATI